MHAMNWADWLIIIIIAISTLISIKRGFIKEALSVANLLLAVFLAWTFAPLLAPKLAGTIDSATLRYISALGIVFVSSLLIGAALNFILSSLIKAGGLSGTDRLLGMLFGALRGLVIVMTCIVFLPKALPVKQDSWWNESLLISKLSVFEDRFTEARIAIQGAVRALFTKENQQKLENKLPESMQDNERDQKS